MCYDVGNSRIPFLIVSAPYMPARHLFGGFTHHLFGGPRRPTVLLASLRYTSNSSLFCTFCTLLQKSESHLLPLQPLPASLQKPRVCHQKRSSNSADFALFTDRGTRSTGHAPVTPLSATLTRNRGEGRATGRASKTLRARGIATEHGSRNPGHALPTETFCLRTPYSAIEGQRYTSLWG